VKEVFPVAAILLLIGASMVIEPERLGMISQDLGGGIRTFLEWSARDPFWGYRRQRPWLRVDKPEDMSARTKKGIRIVGVAVIVLGLLVVAAS
jgi:hypothetical protein